jgi:hypothetical protein
MSAQVLDRPQIHTHTCGHAHGVADDAPTAEREKCHMPCQAEASCGGVCTKGWQHGGPHDCNQNALHSWG